MINLFKVYMSPNVADALKETVESGFISQGKKVDEYEHAVQAWFNYRHIISLNSATSGLTLALRLLNLPPGAHVLVTPLTCFATIVPIMANHLHPKWVDVADDCNMDLNDLESKITPETKAILVVHWGGNPVNMERLCSIRDKYNIPVIEDCAHAFGSEWKKKRIGTFGNMAVFSTQAIKHLTTGDGGLLTLPTPELVERAKLLRWYGIDRAKRSKGDFRLENDIVEWGYKFHMNDINATIGLGNLPHMPDILAKHRANAKVYNDCIFSTIKKIKINPNANPSYWIYTLRVPDKEWFILFMKEYGVVVSQVHQRCDIHTTVSAYQTLLPNLDKLEKEIVCIPVGWWLETSELNQIVHAIKKWDVSTFREAWIYKKRI